MIVFDVSSVADIRLLSVVDNERAGMALFVGRTVVNREALGSKPGPLIHNRHPAWLGLFKCHPPRGCGYDTRIVKLSWHRILLVTLGRYGLVGSSA